MMKLMFCHIGTHRTGTTFIQKLFARSRGELLQRGILYPETGVDVHGTHNSWFLDNVNGLELKDKSIQLNKEFELSRAQAILISGEEAFSRGPEYLLETFSSYRVHPIIFLREPFSLFHSLWAFHIQYDNYCGSYSEFLQASSYIKNYPAQLKAWKRMFPTDLCVKKYLPVKGRNSIFEQAQQILSILTRYGLNMEDMEFTCNIDIVNQSLATSQLLFYLEVLRRIRDFEFLEHLNADMRWRLMNFAKAFDYSNWVSVAPLESEWANESLDPYVNELKDIYGNLLPSHGQDEIQSMSKITCPYATWDKNVLQLCDMLAHAICGLSPLPHDFDVDEYVKLNPDVVSDAKMRPDNHWRRYGCNENRRYSY